MEVPLPRACSRRLMSFFTFHISMFFSASLACGALIVSEGAEYGHSSSRRCVGKVEGPESAGFSYKGCILLYFGVLNNCRSGNFFWLE